MDKLQNFSADNWRALGVRLKVPCHELNGIAEDNKKVKDRLISVIDYWIRNGEETTWEVLWEALCAELVAHKNIGKNIKKWYMKKSWNDPRVRIHCVIRYNNHWGILDLV